MEILDWWCHRPFHHGPNSSFNSLEFHLRNNLPWILTGWSANCPVPWWPLMLAWRACAWLWCPCPFLPQTLPRPACLSPGHWAAACCKVHSVPDDWLVESPACLPSAVTFPEWSGPDSSTAPFLLPTRERRDRRLQPADLTPVQGPAWTGVWWGTLKPVDCGIKIDTKTCSPRDLTVSWVGRPIWNKNYHLRWPVRQMFPIFSPMTNGDWPLHFFFSKSFMRCRSFIVWNEH